ncbi:MAG: GNAT family N-acetyltransferase [Promethearchaeota archaeon]|nr:MAG: GNAT family N-acetyltransferase [Candidatus Lokiarchaeota archaeon]
MGKHKDLELDVLKLPLVEFVKVKGLQLRYFNKDQDAKALADLFNTIWKESSGPEMTLSEARARELPENRVILGEIDGQLVGFVIFDLLEEEGEKKGIFRFIGVRKEYRGRKIASAMAFRAGEDLLRFGITKVKSFIPEKNTEALKLMNFFGFEKKKDLEYTPKLPS